MPFRCLFSLSPVESASVLAVYPRHSLEASFETRFFLDFGFRGQTLNGIIVGSTEMKRLSTEEPPARNSSCPPRPADVGGSWCWRPFSGPLKDSLYFHCFTTLHLYLYLTPDVKNTLALVLPSMWGDIMQPQPLTRTIPTNP